MAIAITCSCSARLEVDEKFAGQNITCPDCQSALIVPRPAVVKTSAFALASLVLAVVGAFTLIGTLLAIALGVVGLLHIRAQPDRLAGRNFAVAGIALGATFSLLTLFAFSSVELFGLDPALREAQWLGKLDYSGPLEVQRHQDGFEIRRPSQQWGVFKGSGGVSRRWNSRPQDFLMVNPARKAYVLVLPEDMPIDASFDECKQRAERVLRDVELSNNALQRGHHPDVTLDFHPKGNRILPSKDKVKAMERRVDKTYHGQTRTFLLRIYRLEGDNIMYVVAGGADKSAFDAAEREIQEALNSFRIVERPIGGAFEGPPGGF